MCLFMFLKKIKMYLSLSAKASGQYIQRASISREPASITTSIFCFEEKAEDTWGGIKGYLQDGTDCSFRQHESKT